MLLKDSDLTPISWDWSPSLGWRKGKYNELIEVVYIMFPSNYSILANVKICDHKWNTDYWLITNLVKWSANFSFFLIIFKVKKTWKEPQSKFLSAHQFTTKLQLAITSFKRNMFPFPYSFKLANIAPLGQDFWLLQALARTTGN